ncbi:hypothetical protein ACFONC_01390 [Luteimonas soli]|uniref:Lipoprotein n=1 Tax=Luteimonas soli TaxID=1648966 RepID=A0ABV7XF51_9GAMM
MKKVFAPLLLALIAAGCSGGREPSPEADLAAQQKAETTSAQEPVQEQGAEQELYSRLPDPSLRFDFGFQFKADQVVEKNGAKRRGLSIEYSGVQGEALWQRVDAGFTTAGYVPHGPISPQPNGSQSRTYDRAGTESITVSVAPRSEAQVAKGVGIIWLGWPLPKDATAPVAATVSED